MRSCRIRRGVFVVWSLTPGLLACGGPGGGTVVFSLNEDAHIEDVEEHLTGRLFRLFEPGKDADPRKAVVIDLSDGLRLWAQYAEGRRAISEWEIIAEEYWVKSLGSKSPATLIPVFPKSHQLLPTECRDCIDASGVIIEARNVFDPDRVEFRVHDPHRVLPSPFPIVGDWTRFQEDEIAN